MTTDRLTEVQGLIDWIESLAYRLSMRNDYISKEKSRELRALREERAALQAA